MQIEEHNKLVRLFDTYGQLLSPRQREVMEKFLNLDYTESEIAEASGQTRQAVHDAITKAVSQLRKYESSCKVIRNADNCKVMLQTAKNLINIQNLRSMAN